MQTKTDLRIEGGVDQLITITPNFYFGFRMVRCWRGTLKQPFGIKLFWNIHHAHPRFLNKTVLVVNNDVTAAFHLLNRFFVFLCKCNTIFGSVH